MTPAAHQRKVVELATRALPLMSPEDRAEAEAILAEVGSPKTMAAAVATARALFEKDMQPVCSAIAAALHAGDRDALKGLSAMLPHLLEEVNQAPALADLLALQLGKAVVEGMQEELQRQREAQP